MKRKDRKDRKDTKRRVKEWGVKEKRKVKVIEMKGLIRKGNDQWLKRRQWGKSGEMNTTRE